MFFRWQFSSLTKPNQYLLVVLIFSSSCSLAFIILLNLCRSQDELRPIPSGVLSFPQICQTCCNPRAIGLATPLPIPSFPLINQMSSTLRSWTDHPTLFLQRFSSSSGIIKSTYLHGFVFGLVCISSVRRVIFYFTCCILRAKNT